jgi:methionyl-tRNA synthetase
MLKGAGYDVPYAVVASGMVRVEGKIFSKSRGYVIWIEEDYLNNGLDPDALRYYIASYTGHTRDLDFSWSTYGEKVNKELVATLGNFLYRALLFAYRNYKAIPDGNVESDVQLEVENTIKVIRDGLDEYEFKKIADAILGLAAFGNRYLQAREPWRLKKNAPKKAEEAVHNALWIAKALAVLIEPLMPFKAESLWKQLGENRENVPLKEALKPLKVGSPLEKPSLLFKQVDDETLNTLSEIVSKRIELAKG